MEVSLGSLNLAERTDFRHAVGGPSDAGSIIWTRRDVWCVTWFATVIGATDVPWRSVRSAPGWLDLHDPGGGVSALAFGWPARAFAVRTVAQITPQPGASGVNLLRLSPSPAVWPSSWYDHIYAWPFLPNRIIWSGVIVNGLTYAAIIALVVFTHRRLRLAMFRRRAKAPCLRCGYERMGLGPQAPCPECGAPAPIARVADASSG